MKRPVAIACSECKRSADLKKVLDNCGKFNYSVWTLTYKCPACRKSTELRVERGRIELGYIYFAGSAHFEAVETVKAPGVTAAVHAFSLVVRVQGKRWRFPMPSHPEARKLFLEAKGYSSNVPTFAAKLEEVVGGYPWTLEGYAAWRALQSAGLPLLRAVRTIKRMKPPTERQR